MPARTGIVSSSSGFASTALCRLPTRLCDWFCSLSEPVFKTRRAESRALIGNQRPLAHLDAVVPPVRVGDHLAGIPKRRQGPSGEFIQMKLFRPPDFNGALHG